MKNLILTLVAVAALSSTVFAHHLSPSDTAGGNMSDSSGHLTNSMLALIY